MKILLNLCLSAFSLLICTISYCQDSLSFFKSISTYPVDKQNLTPETTLHVKTIQIKDNRPDTTCIGLFKMVRQNNVRLVPGNIKNLEALFSSFITNDTSKTDLYVVVDHFFISNNPLNVNDITRTHKPMHSYPGRLTMQAKVYIKQNGYYQGLTKIDTVLVSEKSIDASWQYLLEDGLSLFFNSVGSSLNNNNYSRHPKITKEHIDSANQAIQLRAGDADSTSGYYNTYSDFANGAVAHTKFSLVRLQEGCYYAYTMQPDGSQALERNIWGLKKGNILYIMNDGVLFPLYKNNNAYYWMGTLQYVEKPALPPFLRSSKDEAEPSGSGHPNTELRITLAPYLLNLQTGLRY